ncbi:MAG: ABC transporter permease, partial [Longimicrobiales bacterium]
MDDLKFAWRQLRRSAGFAVFITVTLGIGIGANSTIFSAINAILLRPLPYADSERLIALNGEYTLRGDDWSVSLPNALDWGQRSTSLEGAGYYRENNVTLAGEQPERLEAVRMSASLPRLLGAGAAAGRWFAAEEDSPGSPPVVVISHAFWQQRFAGQNIIGRALTLSGKPHTVIGVAPAALNFPSADVQVYLPIQEDRTTWN